MSMLCGPSLSFIDARDWTRFTWESDWLGTKRTSVWFQINRKMVNTIWFRVDLIRFRKDFSVSERFTRAENRITNFCEWNISAAGDHRNRRLFNRSDALQKADCAIFWSHLQIQLQAVPVFSSVYPSLIWFSSSSFPGAPYRIFPSVFSLYFFQFYFVVIITTTIWSDVWETAILGTQQTAPLIHLCPPLRSTFAVRETASLGIMGEPRVPPLNPSETIVLWEHYRLWGV